MKPYTTRLTMRQTSWVALALLLALCITYVLYSPGLSGMFLLDDFSNIGPTILSEWNFDQLIQITVSNHSGMFGRPVPTLSFSLTSLLHGESSYSFKLHNLLIHLIIGLAIFKLSEKLFSVSDKITRPTSAWLALAIMTLWLLHPLNVSTVLYAVQRMTQLLTLFAVLGMLFYLLALTSQNNKTKLFLYILAVPIATLLAIFSKENGVLVPVYFGLIALLLRNAINWRVIDKGALTIFCIIPLAVGAVVFLLEIDRFIDYSSRDFTLEQRLMSQIDFVTLYIKQIFFPRLSSMGLYFDDYIFASQLTLSLVLKLLMLVSVLLLGVIGFLRSKLWGFGLCLFFAGHVIESTVFPLEIAFEHRNYFPMLGLLIFLVSAGQAISVNPRLKVLVLSMYLVLFSVLLSTRVGFWSNHVDWFQTILAFKPNSERTRLEHGYYLNKAGDDEAAAEVYRESMELFPDHLSFPILYLVSSCETGEPQDKLATLERIKHLISRKKLTTTGFNSLATLAQPAVLTTCKSLSREEVIDIANHTIKEQTRLGSDTLPYLKVMDAQIKIVLGESEAAADLLLTAAQETKKAEYAFSALSVLLSDPATKEQAEQLYESFKQGDFFNPRLYRYELEKMAPAFDSHN